MKLPDELLDNFKYAITNEDIPMLEEALTAGMLLAAEIAERMFYFHTPDDGVVTGEGIADEIRKRARVE